MQCFILYYVVSEIGWHFTVSCWYDEWFIYLRLPTVDPTSQLLILLVVLVTILLVASLLGLTQVWTAGMDLILPSSNSSPNANGKLAIYSTHLIQ